MENQRILIALPMYVECVPGLLLEFLETLPAQLGCSYGGTLVKGDNFGIRVVEEAQREQLVKPYEQMGVLYGQSGNFFAQEAKDFTGPEFFPKATQIFIGLIFKFFAGRTFRKVAAGWGCTKPLDDRPYH